MNKQMNMRVGSIVLSLTVLLGLLPVSAFGEGGGEVFPADATSSPPGAATCICRWCGMN